MTYRLILQQEKDLKPNILGLLIDLKDNCDLSSREIAERLGINENYLSRVFKGRAQGSTQLLEGLKLLKKVIIYEQAESRRRRNFLRR